MLKSCLTSFTAFSISLNLLRQPVHPPDEDPVLVPLGQLLLGRIPGEMISTIRGNFSRVGGFVLVDGVLEDASGGFPVDVAAGYSGAFPGSGFCSMVISCSSSP